MLRVKELREAKKFSQECLAEKVGVTHATVQRWEAGKRQIPSGRIPKLAKALEVHPGEIFAELPTYALTAEQRRAADIADNLELNDLVAWLEMGNRLRGKTGAPKPEVRRRSMGK